MILLSNAYFYPLDAKQWKFKQPYPPLGTLLAASVLINSGFELKFFDNSLQRSLRPFVNVIQKMQPKHLIIYDDGFNYLTKMCLLVMRQKAFEMIDAGKKAGATVIVCNSDSSDHYEKYLVAGADYIIRGEGEETLLELIKAIDQKKTIDRIEGIVYRDAEKAIVNPARAILKDLNALPLPAWHLVDMNAYRKIWQPHHGYFSLNLATTRGCPYKCNWCAKPIYGNRYHARSPEHVIREIELLLKDYHPQHFWMSDDIFGLKPGWILRFRDLVKEKGLQFTYKIQSRADLLLEDDTITALAESGAETVWIGAESGSQKILDAMDKGITTEQIRKATALLEQHGIKVGYFLQFGYLGETLTDIHQTINMVLEMMPDEIGISVSYPLPGTKFYDQVKTELNEKQNWVDSDDLDLMYSSPYPRHFYKQLQRYVHQLYRMKRANQTLKLFFQKPFTIRPVMLRALASGVYHGLLNIRSRLALKKFQLR
jgi:anaerobic magnesium-protoporphyrin IX monomethyl ester cyclase